MTVQRSNPLVQGTAAAVLVVAALWTAAPPADAARTAPGRVSAVRTGGGYTFDFQEADVRTVLATLARAGDVNIVSTPEVKGPVTLRLENVSWREALDAVLRTRSLGMVESNHVIRVAPVQTVLQEAIDRETAERKKEELLPLSTEVVAVRYADAGEMKVAVERTLTKRGHVEVDARTNQLVITDIRDQLVKALALVHQLDTSTQQIEIVAKLVDMDTGVARELGARWRLLRPGKGLIRNGTSIPIEGPYDDDLAGGGDLPLPGMPRDGDFTVRAVGNTLTLDAQIHALETERKATLLSNPRVVTVNNREARILVGQRIPLIVSDVSGNPITQLQTIGIQLKVTPHITEGGTITLDVHPEVSDLSTQATVQGGVIINTSEADTRVVVENGQSAMIGGMIRQVESTQSEGVPILSKIPLIGALFRYTNKTKQNRELVIFLTPRIVPPGQG